MQSYQTCWEDEENNREVRFRVDVARNEGAVEVLAVTPEKVTFLCPESGDHLRTIGVHTAKGRTMLTQQYQNSGRLESALAEVAPPALVN